MAGPMLQVLEGGVPESSAETDPGGLGSGWEVSLKQQLDHALSKRNIQHHQDIRKAEMMFRQTAVMMCFLSQAAARRGGGLCQQSQFLSDPASTVPLSALSLHLLQVWGEENQREDP